MKTKKIQLSEDLSYIDNIEDLESKIRRTKAALRVDGMILKEGFKKIPSEGIKASVGSVVPFFAKTVVADKTWNAVQSVVSILMHNPESSNAKGFFSKKHMQQSLKKIGIFAALSLLKSFLTKRHNKD